MKKFICSLLLLVMSTSAFAECDFSTGVTANADGSRTYTKECHIKVGEMKRDLEIAQKDIVDYKKTIELKDLALVKSEQRANMWMETSFKIQDKFESASSLQRTSETLYFGLGVATAVLAVWAAGQLRPAH